MTNQLSKSFYLFKRFVDVVATSLLLLLFAPIMLLTAILVRVSSPGPITFKQKRVGLKGREFDIIKFRSMYCGDNDHRLAQNPNLYQKYKESGWKLPMAEDPRITPIGRLIRTFTIDEFPQLINVLKGEMSLVGPRAYRKIEVEDQCTRYPEFKHLIHDILSVRPGITGPWQVSGRNDIPFLERARIDADYAKNKSILRDLAILLRTPFCMFSKW